MAEKILQTRILNKIDTLENWNKSTLKIKKGEICLATVAASAGTGLEEPVVMMKVGTAEEKTFAELPWAFYARSSDVLAACKSEATLTAFINNVIDDAGIASDDAMQELAGRVTTVENDLNTADTGLKARMAAAEADIAALDDLVGDKKVATQISDAIAALNLETTYAAKSHTHEIADVNGLSDSIAAAKKAGTDANAALEAYKTLNDAAVKVNSDAIAAIKNGETLDNFKEVEEALAGKQVAGDYATKTEAQGYANAKDAAIQAAQKTADDAAAAAAQALVDAKAYTDGFTGGKTVAAAISETIANYTTTADMNAAIATAKGEATSHADGLNTAMNTRVEALEAIDHSHTFVESELNLIQAGDVAKWNAAEQNAKDHADDLDEAMNERVAALENKFIGDDSVSAQLNAAIAAEAKLREDADTALQNQIGEASAEGKAATGLHARIEELEGLVGDDKVSEAIADAVQAEKERAEGIEGDLETRLAAVEADYLTSTEEKTLQDQITANASAIELLTNGVKADEVDGVNDLIKYVKEHGTEVTGMKNDIKANGEAVESLEGRMDTAEGAIALKAAQADLEALDGRVEIVEGKVATLEGEMDAAQADIEALEGYVGGKKVSEAISEAIEAALKIEGVDKYALASALTDAIARIAQNETDIGALETEVAKKANDADLAAIAKTGSTDDLVQGELVLLFDCGGAN